MRFRDFFWRSSPEVTETSEYLVRRAYNDDCVDGQFDKYDLKKMTRGGKVVDRVFIPQIKGKPPNRLILCLTTRQYGLIKKQIRDKSLTEKQYKHLQRHHVDSEEEKSVLVKLVKSGDDYSIVMLGEVLGTPKKKNK